MSDDEDDDFQEPTLEEPPKFDAGDPKAVGKRKADLKLRDEEGRRFWNAVFASRVGRREIYGLLRSCSAFDQRFACGPNGFPQPEATWFQAGESEWGRRMREQWCVERPAEFALMLRENDPRFQKDGN